jgi:hypothetical protein
LARAWENASDDAVAAYNAGEIQSALQKTERIKAAKQKVTQELDALNQQFENHVRSFGFTENEVRGLMKMTPNEKANMVGNDSFIKAQVDYLAQSNPVTESQAKMMEGNPWIAKVDPNTSVYSPYIGDLGFDHITDVLREDLAAGRIRPEQLNKISMEQAVRRTYEYDQELAAKMNAARASAREGLPVYKEYPEGFRWMELNKPGAFTSESEAMGHSVRGYEPPKGHADWTEGSGDSGSSGYGHGGWEAIKSGKAKVYSLVDKEGQPHVTVEVKNSGMTPEQRTYKVGIFAQRLIDEGNTPEKAMAQAEKIYPEGENKQFITQIKGKQNRAPKEDYLPFVQDFVKGGQWSDVGDLQNTGLRPTKDAFNETEQAFLKSKGVELKPYIDPEETARYQELFKQSPPEPGMAEGGAVSDAKQRLLDMIAKEPHMAGGGEVHMAGGGEVHMGFGGVPGKAKKLANAAKAAEKKVKVEHPLVFPRAAAKTLEDIRPIAQRMAEQVTGEFVKQNPKVTTNPAGKSRKQFERERNIPLETRNVVPERPAPDVNYEDYKGYGLVGVPGDPTMGGVAKRGSLEATAQPTVELTRVGDITPDYPVPLFGGPRYGDENKFWASDLASAVPVQNSVNELAKLYEFPILGKYIKMADNSENFALHNLDALLSIQRPEKLSKAKMAELTQRIQAGSPKYGKFPGFTGFKDPADVLLQAMLAAADQ